ncbi:capsid cement protein [Grimontia hollisae]|uniref:capsid cement protein n=1 Tax=Grimontia hollisae TaxID=673 RepID=UPI001303165D|nr:capsid cement protein [Grimontia hollisae]
MRIAEGKKIAIIAPSGGVTKDVPFKAGVLLLVPVKTANAGEVVTCYRDGHFSGPVKAGDEPTFNGEPAYFEGGEFTKTQPTTAGEVSQPVGAFVDSGVLLTGELLTELVAGA